jgi:hypothetical protein
MQLYICHRTRHRIREPRFTNCSINSRKTASIAASVIRNSATQRLSNSRSGRNLHQVIVQHCRPQTAGNCLCSVGGVCFEVRVLQVDGLITTADSRWQILWNTAIKAIIAHLPGHFGHQNWSQMVESSERGTCSTTLLGLASRCISESIPESIFSARPIHFTSFVDEEA